MSHGDTPSEATQLPEALARIEARLERLEARSAPVAELASQAPAAIAVAVDTLDAHLAQLGDADERLRSAARLLIAVTEPETLQRLERLLQTLPALEQLSTLAKDAPHHVATVVDTADGLMARVLASGIDPHTLGVAALDTGHGLAEALVAARQAPPPPVGPFGLLGALSEPEVQRALGFLLVFARRFGATLPA
jgi:uncharacterized protein YjgD (DUF1641 family)